MADPKTNDAPKDPERSQIDAGGDSLRVAVLQLGTSGNGRSLTGVAVPYNVLAEIRDQRGHYQERIAAGAFAEALSNSKPRMLFEHGLDMRTGKTPIGSFDRVWEEADGLHVSGQLFDNQLVQPLTDAARAGELAEWSIHFRTRDDGSDETWQRVKGWDVRTVNRAQLPEISLVNVGAYPTTVSIRSGIDDLPDLTGQSDARSVDGGDSSDAAPGNGSPSPEELLAQQQRNRNELRIRRIQLRE